MSNVTRITGNLCNKCPKWLVEQISSYSDYFNVISGFTSNSRAQGGPVTLTQPVTRHCLKKTNHITKRTRASSRKFLIKNKVRQNLTTAHYNNTCSVEHPCKNIERKLRSLLLLPQIYTTTQCVKTTENREVGLVALSFPLVAFHKYFIIWVKEENPKFWNSNFQS